jgi:hypothetical protein
LHIDPIKIYAAIYFKGFITRKLEESKTSGILICGEELFQLADIAIRCLTSFAVSPGVKVHFQSVL